MESFRALVWGRGLALGTSSEDGDSLFMSLYRAVLDTYDIDISEMPGDEEHGVWQLRSMLTTILYNQCRCDSEECRIRVEELIRYSYASLNLDQYVASMQLPFTDGDALVVQFFAVAFGVPVHVYVPGRELPVVFAPDAHPFCLEWGAPFDLYPDSMDMPISIACVPFVFDERLPGAYRQHFIPLLPRQERGVVGGAAADIHGCHAAFPDGDESWIPKVSSVQMQTFLENLDHAGLASEFNVGDGNCLFRALHTVLCTQFQRDVGGHNVLREVLVNFLEARCSTSAACHAEVTAQLDTLYGCADLDRYLSHMRRDGVWGDHIMIQCFATLFAVRTDLWVPTQPLPMRFNPFLQPFAVKDEDDIFFANRLDRGSVVYIALVPYFGSESGLQACGGSANHFIPLRPGISRSSASTKRDRSGVSDGLEDRHVAKKQVRFAGDSAGEGEEG